MRVLHESTKVVAGSLLDCELKSFDVKSENFPEWE